MHKKIKPISNIIDFSNNFSFENNNKLILPKDEKNNDKYLPIHADKKPKKNYAHKTFSKYYSNNIADIKLEDKKEKINKYKGILDESLLLNELPLSNKTHIDKKSNIKDEFENQRKDLLEKIQQCKKLLKNVNTEKKNAKASIKKNNDNKYSHNTKSYNTNYKYYEPKKNYNEKEIKNKNNINKNNDDNERYKRLIQKKYSYGKKNNNDYLINEKIEKIHSNLLYDEPNETKTPYKKANINSQENFDYNSHNNLKKHKKGEKSDYNINSLYDINFNDYKINENSFISKMNNTTYNNNKSDLYKNYLNAEEYPSYNKKKIGLITLHKKNNDEYYLNKNNVHNIRKDFLNKNLKKYINSIEDNSSDINPNDSLY
jgi:hypothetical protein